MLTASRVASVMVSPSRALIRYALMTNADDCSIIDELIDEGLSLSICPGLIANVRSPLLSINVKHLPMEP